MPAESSWRSRIALIRTAETGLILLIAMAVMFLASPVSNLPLERIFLGGLGIALLLVSAMIAYQILGQHVDALMPIRSGRPLVSGVISVSQAAWLVGLSGVSGCVVLALGDNWTSLALALAAYGLSIGLYQGLLRSRLPQGVVLLAVAVGMLPAMSWAAIWHELHASVWWLSILLFLWLIPVYWARVIAHLEDYQLARLPLLPLTHGVGFASLQILLFTLAVLAASLMLFASAIAGVMYLAGAVGLGAGLLFYALRLLRQPDAGNAAEYVNFAKLYLVFLYAFLLLDHYLPLIQFKLG